MNEVTTNESWLARLGEAAKGIVLGVVLFVAAFPLLFLNEGRAVRTARGLSEGASAVVRVDSETVDPAHEGQLVHTSGRAATSQTLSDDTFGVSAPGIRLQRHVEMYQWKEKSTKNRKKKLGGGTRTTTTYQYEMVWATKLIDSGSFARAEDHRNPAVMPFDRSSTQASEVSLGGFQLPEALISQVLNDLPVPLSVEQLPEEIAARATVAQDAPGGGDRLYVRAAKDAFERESSSGPRIGDVRVWFTLTPESDVSVMARQVGTSFEPYHTAADTELQLLVNEITSPEAMIARAEAANSALTWMLRGVGFLMSIGGIVLVLRPLVVLADVLPLLGSLMELGVGLVASLIGGGLSLCTISVGWVFYRPLLGVPLLLIGLTLLGLLVRKAILKKRQLVSEPPATRIVPLLESIQAQPTEEPS